MNINNSNDALFTHATEGILVVNDKGSIIKINPSAEKLFRYPKGELLGKAVEVLVPKHLAHKHNERRADYNKHPHSRSMGAGMDLYGLKKDGTEFPLEISLTPYSNEEGKFIIAFIVDITQRKTSEIKIRNHSIELEQTVKERTLILEEAIAELEKTKENLNEALLKEKELNELKSRFVSMASHEFRTPLATIQSSLALVKKYGELQQKEKQEKHIAKIKSSISNLTDILNDFLSLSKLEEGKVENMPEFFDMEQFILETINEIQSIAKPGQTIRYLHTGVCNAFLDKKLLKNILLNLISNAIKFSEENTSIEVTSFVKTAAISITVADKGIGIPAADQKHLFERFFRGQNVTHVQGTGLGLNIVAKYVGLMNGYISVDSKENTGTTIVINFSQ